jgi:hypothetical protein
MALLALVPTTACAGSRSWISAPDATYPVSLSRAVRDIHGDVHLSRDLVRVGTFSYEYTSRHMLFTLIPLGQSRHDLSDEIDRQVARVGGEAVVNLTVTARYSAWTSFAALLAGILPTQSHVKISADIVARHVAGEPAAPPEAPPDS